MKGVHEGLNPANQQAEQISHKLKMETFVTKENIGGLRYVVYDNKEKIPTTAKIISHYVNGDKKK